MTTKYIVSCITYWKDVILSAPIPLSGVDKSFGVGFMPVFDTKEAAKEQFPDIEVTEVIACEPKETDNE